MGLDENTILFEGPFQSIEIIPCENGKQVLDEFEGNGIEFVETKTGIITYLKLTIDEIEDYLLENKDERSYEDALSELLPHLNLKDEGEIVKVLYELIYLNGRVTDIETGLVKKENFKIVLSELVDIIPEIKEQIGIMKRLIDEKKDTDRFLVSIRFDTSNKDNGFTVCLNGNPVGMKEARRSQVGGDPVAVTTKTIQDRTRKLKS